MNLLEAPKNKFLYILSLSAVGDELGVLEELGLAQGECIKKVHIAPLGDPIGIQIGEQVFSLRLEHCRKIQVREAE